MKYKILILMPIKKKNFKFFNVLFTVHRDKLVSVQ